jgi:methionyl-tRNA formyltransferase
LRRPARVVFLTSGGIFPRRVFGRLLAMEGFEVVGVVRSVRVHDRRVGFLRGAWRFFTRCGIPYTVYIWLVTTFAEWLGWLGCASGIEALARGRRVPVLRTRDVNRAGGVEFLRGCAPDLLLCVHFDQRLYPPLCDGGLCAAVNLHPGRLPAYRGLEPVIQGVLAGDEEFHVTLHRIAEGIDEGKVIADSSLRIDDGESVCACTCRLMEAGAELLEQHRGLLLERGAGRMQGGGGGYFGWPVPSASGRLLAKGHWLMGWGDWRLFFAK